MAWGDKKAGIDYDAKRKTAHFNVVMRGTFHRKKKTLKAITRSRPRPRTGDSAKSGSATGLRPHAARLLGSEFQKRKSTVGEKTWEGYVWAAEKKILPALGDTRLANVTDAVVTDFAVQLEQHGGKGGRPVSASTVNRCLDLIRAILKDAYTRRVLSEMPVREFPRREENEPHNELTEHEVERFYAALEQFPRERPYVIIANADGHPVRGSRATYLGRGAAKRGGHHLHVGEDEGRDDRWNHAPVPKGAPRTEGASCRREAGLRHGERSAASSCHHPARLRACEGRR